jgi:hypothetical protein
MVGGLGWGGLAVRRVLAWVAAVAVIAAGLVAVEVAGVAPEVGGGAAAGGVGGGGVAVC